MRKKLLLISVVDTESYINKEYVTPVQKIKSWQPLPLGIIAALTPDDWDVEIIDENFEDFQFKEADLVGISSFTIGINKAYKIAQIYKKENIPSVIGGMHVSFFPEEAIKYADIVAVGKAEGLWPDIIRDFNNHSLKKTYYSNEKAPVCFMPKRVVFEKYKYKVANIMASLGCPNNCSYCNIPVFQKNKHYLRDIDDVIDEIKGVEQDYFIFNDDNFFGTSDNHRARVVEMLNKMIDEKINKKWLCTTSINISNFPDILWLAHKAGCVSIFTGMESLNKSELEQFNKKININFSVNNYKKAINTIHKNKISVWGSFICGGLEETLESLTNKGAELRKLNLDNTILLFLTPLPKTQLYNDFEKQGNLLYTSYPQEWIYYNFTTPTFISKFASPQDFFVAYKKTSKFIFAPFKGIIKNYRIMKFIRTCISTRSIKVAVDSAVFFSFYDVNGYKSKFFRTLFKWYHPQLNFFNFKRRCIKF